MSVKSTQVAVYDAPHQFEPLLLSDRHIGEMRELGDQLACDSLRLQGGAHHSVLNVLRDLVRAMNSYYSNRIEGQSTHPLYIAQALRQNFQDQPDIARRQRLALAHVHAEQALESQVRAGADPLCSGFAIQAHQELYERLDEADRQSEEGTPIEPGEIRTVDVQVHRHQPPTFSSLPRFLARFDKVYAKRWLMNDLPHVVASAHHRLAWVHPFTDGNGRATRLQTHAALWTLSCGLWSVNRGFARRRDEYYRHLSEADMTRQGDLDGRGNLSERMLAKWCRFFLEVCLDQVTFMGKMLDLPNMKTRISQLVTLRRQDPARALTYRPEVQLVLYHLFAAGPLTRGEFQQMTGLTERTATRVLKGLLEDGIVTSEGRRSQIQLGLPLDTLPVLLPGLYPEAAVPL